MDPDNLDSLEHALAAAVRSRDREAAELLLDESFELTSSLGTGLRVDKEAWLASLVEIETERFSFRALESRVVDGTGVVVSWADWSARWGDDDLSGPYVVTDVWSRATGSWRLRWRTWARLNAEFLVEELCG